MYVQSDFIYLFERISKQKMYARQLWEEKFECDFYLLLLLKETLLNTIKGNHETFK